MQYWQRSHQLNTISSQRYFNLRSILHFTNMGMLVLFVVLIIVLIGSVFQMRYQY